MLFTSAMRNANAHHKKNRALRALLSLKRAARITLLRLCLYDRAAGLGLGLERALLSPLSSACRLPAKSKSKEQNHFFCHLRDQGGRERK
jgi:hypothetical protein